MRKILIFLMVICSFAFSGENFPELSGVIVDKAGVISEVAKSDLERMIKEHEAKYGKKLVIVTGKLDKETNLMLYVSELAKHWNIGNDTAILFVDSRNKRAEIGSKDSWLDGESITYDIMGTNLKKGNIDNALKLGVMKTLDFMDDDKSNDYINHPHEDTTIAMLAISIFGGVVVCIIGYKFDLTFLTQVGMASVLTGMLTTFLMKALPYGMPSFIFFGIVSLFTFLTMRINIREDNSRYLDLGVFNSLFGINKVEER